MLPSRVEQIIGIPEEKLVRIKNRSRFIKRINSRQFFTNGDGGLIPTGEFGIISISDLERILSLKAHNTGRTDACRFSIMEGVDIGVLQSTLQTDDYAMVQVASNFNCLEVPSVHMLPNDGNLVENAYRDSTQGPAACFGPLAAYLYRAHFVFRNVHDNGHVSVKGQTAGKQINLLEDVGDYFGVPTNGKLILTGDETKIKDGDSSGGDSGDSAGDTTAATIDTAIDTVVKKIKVGLHTNALVLYGRDNQGRNFELDEPYPTIDQCFSSTINLRDHRWNAFRSTPIDTAVPNRALLRAAYEGVYLSALVRRRSKLYLTLIGGGVYANDVNMIIEEMVRAHKKYANHPVSHLTDVYLCVYDSHFENKEAVLSQLE